VFSGEIFFFIGYNLSRGLMYSGLSWWVAEGSQFMCVRVDPICRCQFDGIYLLKELYALSRHLVLNYIIAGLTRQVILILGPGFSVVAWHGGGGRWVHPRLSV